MRFPFQCNLFPNKNSTCVLDEIPEGGMAAAPVVTRDGYTFTGWDKDFSKVTSDMTVTALWEKNTVPPESGGNSSSGSSKSSSSDRGENSRPDTSELHGNWEQTVTGIWMFKMTGGSYAKKPLGAGKRCVVLF